MLSKKLYVSHLREFDADLDFPIVIFMYRNFLAVIKTSWKFSDMLVKMKLLGQICPTSGVLNENSAGMSLIKKLLM